ncbi:MAG TPA: carboxypeptidase-like regulatory domain-containing protein, partial [Flavisolibacter sp.]|nr:carboxypeptidase-like regulatory domain-containing protein [Flavisolibacter sp.]
MKMYIVSLCAFLLLFSFTQQAIAQNLQIKGKVTSKTSGGPLLGASVVIKGTSTGTTTDDQGAFTINVPSRGTVLVISYAGAVTQEYTVNDAGPLNIQLDQQSGALNEVVVVG